MAFGFKFGGNKSALQKLLEGVKTEEEKQALIVELNAASPAPADIIPLIVNDDSGLSGKVLTMFTPKADAKTVSALAVETMGAEGGARMNGIKALQRQKEAFLISALEPLLEKPSPDVLRKIWEITLDMPPTVVDKFIDKALQEAPGPQRAGALKRLIKTKGAEAIRPLLLENAANRESAVRKEAVAALINMAGDDIFSVMIDRLGDDNKDTAQLAGTYLQQYITKVPADQRPRVMGKLLLAGGPDQQKQLCQTMFSQGNPAELLVGILTFCKSLTGVQHKLVMNALKTVGDPLLKVAQSVLASPDADLRIQAVYLLEAYADPRMMGALVQMLKDPDWWLRIVVCDTLGRLTDQRAIPALAQMIADPESKWAAIDSIGTLGGEQALAALHPLLKDPVLEVRAAAVTALKKVKDPRVEAMLTEVSQNDVSNDVRLKAVEAIREMHGGEGGSGAVITSQQLTKPIERLLAYAREKGGSDLHITPGEPAVIRINGVLERMEMKKFEADQTSGVLLDLLDPVRKPILDKHGAVDFCYPISGIGRYRSNVFKMKRGIGGVFRAIPNIPPTFVELGLPKHLADIGTYHQGIVLVTGPAGSGKSTTLMALINVINESRASHILTFEDPVEFIHPIKKSLINQREIGKDSQSYAAAMRGALREDPDVIVVGDMRDAETIRLALLAAETGHLVVATMQTTGAVATIDKLVESFPVEEQGTVRAALSESLKMIVSQVLVPRCDKPSRIGVYDILKSTAPVRALIRDGKTFQLPSTMVIGRSQGMITIDASLEEKYKEGKISIDTALHYATNKELFEKLKLKGPVSAEAAPAAAPGAPAAPGGPGAAGAPARPSGPGAPGGMARPPGAPGAMPARPPMAGAPGAAPVKKP